jgi:hypothetical protein
MKYMTQNTTLGDFDLIIVFVNCYSFSSHLLPDAQHRVYIIELIRDLLRAHGALARLARVRCQSESQRTMSIGQLQLLLKVQLAETLVLAGVRPSKFGLQLVQLIACSRSKSRVSSRQPQACLMAHTVRI